MDLARAGVAEQRARLWEADIVICTYGSDPLAALFMRAASDMIELTYEYTMDSSAAGAITTMTGINYHMLLCPTAAKNPGRRKDFDIQVDCLEMKRILDGIIDRQEAGQPYAAPLDLRMAPPRTTTM